MTIFMSQVYPNHSWRMALQKVIMKTIATDKKSPVFRQLRSWGLF
jgi:hypothetical protein